jgi:uncharacterized RDD family membrane protein YckC
MKSEYRVLTPESVEFVYDLAGLGSRMVAAALDHLLIVGLLIGIWAGYLILSFFGCMVTAGIFAVVGAGPMLAAARLAVFLVVFGYFAYFEWKWNGQTPGKRMMEIRVIDDRGMNVDPFQSLVRNLFRVIDMLPLIAIPAQFQMALEFIGFSAIGFYGLGGVTALLNPRHKRLGDWAGGTLVVRTRKRVMPAAILAPNEKYNTLQQDAELRNRIRSQLGLEEREMLLQLCLRRHELEFEVRQNLFAETAAYLEERLEIAREPFMSEEKFVQNIAAVALAAQESRVLERAPAGRG